MGAIKKGAQELTSSPDRQTGLIGQRREIGPTPIGRDSSSKSATRRNRVAACRFVCANDVPDYGRTEGKVAKAGVGKAGCGGALVVVHWSAASARDPRAMAVGPGALGANRANGRDTQTAETILAAAAKRSVGEGRLDVLGAERLEEMTVGRWRRQEPKQSTQYDGGGGCVGRVALDSLDVCPALSMR